MRERRLIISPLDWYDEGEWANREEQPRYRQLRVPVPGSFWKTFDEQFNLRLPDEEPASARAVAMLLVIHSLATGDRLLQDCVVRCTEQESDGDRVCVGDFGRDGQLVGDVWDDAHNSDIGLASSRKS